MVEDVEGEMVAGAGELEGAEEDGANLRGGRFMILLWKAFLLW